MSNFRHFQFFLAFNLGFRCCLWKIYSHREPCVPVVFIYIYHFKVFRENVWLTELTVMFLTHGFFDVTKIESSPCKSGLFLTEFRVSKTIFSLITVAKVNV